ncbi:hypothetical protein ACIBTP_37060 [Streptomyces avidinii]|uniref:hypothetical protein n=1 Tax=Streptomyces avidinii TaxID=1895 RepID=UPI0037B47DA6
MPQLDEKFKYTITLAEEGLRLAPSQEPRSGSVLTLVKPGSSETEKWRIKVAKQLEAGWAETRRTRRSSSTW